MNHFSNNHVTFMGTDLGGAVDIVQTTSYYPFGLVMSQTNGNTDPAYRKNKYLYNGKEHQDDVFAGSSLNWFDYGARFYDPQIGRFTTMDPMAEKFNYESPYCYVGNSPLKNIDLDGMEKFSLTLSVGINQGKLGFGTKAIFGHYIPFGSSSYKLTFSTSFDTKSLSLTRKISASYTNTKAGGYSFAIGSGGGTNQSKSSEVGVEYGVSLKNGDVNLIGSASKSNDEKYKTEESGSVGIYTGTSKEGEESKHSIGIKDAEVQLFIIGAESSLCFEWEKSNQQKSDQQKPATNKSVAEIEDRRTSKEEKNAIDK